MAYSKKMRDAIAALPNNRAKRLGKECARLGVPIAWVSHHVGAARMTVYNWFTGNFTVSRAYEKPVDDFLAVLRETQDVELLNPKIKR